MGTENPENPEKNASHMGTSECACPSENAVFMKKFKEERIKKLRKLTRKSTMAPNFKSKIWASRLKDEVDGKEAIKLPVVCGSCEPRVLQDESSCQLPPPSNEQR